MSSRIVIAGVAVLGCLLPQADDSMVAPQHRPQGNVTFQSVRDLRQSGGELVPQLRGGRVANSRDWPASLYMTFATPSGRAACTAALIGPQVLLTAAHCVPASGAVSMAFDERSYPATCTTHPRYPVDPSADYALCRLDSALAAPPGFAYETVSLSAMDALVGETVILGGFGCTSDIVGAGAADGYYRIGFSRIDETSNAASPARHRSLYVTQQVNNLFTADDPALANLCPGDSGGPAFRRTGGADPYSRRQIVGVNSRVFYRDASRSSYGASLVSATGTSDFGNWAKAWTSSAAVSACGITAGAGPHCRS